MSEYAGTSFIVPDTTSALPPELEGKMVFITGTLGARLFGVEDTYRKNGSAVIPFKPAELEVLNSLRNLDPAFSRTARLVGSVLVATSPSFDAMVSTARIKSVHLTDVLASLDSTSRLKQSVDDKLAGHTPNQKEQRALLSHLYDVGRGLRAQALEGKGGVVPDTEDAADAPSPEPEVE